MKPLYELTTEYRSILDHIDEMDESEIDSSLIELLDNMKLPIEQKAINTAAVLKNIEHAINGLKQVEETIKERRALAERKLANIKTYLLNNLVTAGIDKIESDMFSIKVKTNPEKVEAFCENLIPKGYWRSKVITELDKTKLKEALKAGVKIDGVTLIQSKRLEIK